MTPTQEEFDLVNAVLKECGSHGAHNIGVACAMAWEAGVRIDARNLARAAACPTVPEAIDATNAWIKEKAREHSGGR